ncbi:MAG: hypothetical protein HN467_11185 [Opitutae bacterium]|jgi:hypothetical protein|nr:hypothetical protein [Opitutae bacterium]
MMKLATRLCPILNHQVAEKVIEMTGAQSGSLDFASTDSPEDLMERFETGKFFRNRIQRLCELAMNLAVSAAKN